MRPRPVRSALSRRAGLTPCGATGILPVVSEPSSLRVLLVHAWYRDGASSGENRVVQEEAAQLRAAGHEVLLHTADNRDAGRGAAALTLPLRLVHSAPARRTLEEAVAAFRPHVIHVHNVFPSLSPSVLLAGRATGTPVVVTVHNYRPLCASGELFRNGRPCRDCTGTTSLPAVLHGCARDSRLASAAMALHVDVNRTVWRTAPTLVLALSSAMRRTFVEAGFPPDRVAVKGNAVEDRPAARVARPDTVAFLGRFTEVKGVRFLRQAWSQVAHDAQRAGVQLTMAGSGPLEPELRAWAAADATVQVVGLLPPEACRALVARSLAVVVPSVWPEPFGLTAVEAMCGAVPPVAPDHGSFPDMITSGTDGVLYRNGDTGSLAAALRTLLHDRDAAAAMGARARRTYEARYTPDANAAALEQVYRQAMGLAAGRAAPSDPVDAVSSLAARHGEGPNGPCSASTT